MSRRRSGPATSTPSRWSRNSTSVTPTTAADRRSSSSRSGAASSGRTPAMPGLAAGRQQVVHLFAGRRPRRDRGRDAVLDVVGMRRDNEGALPVVGHGLGGMHGSLPPQQPDCGRGRVGFGSDPRRSATASPTARSSVRGGGLWVSAGGLGRVRVRRRGTQPAGSSARRRRCRPARRRGRPRAARRRTPCRADRRARAARRRIGAAEDLRRLAGRQGRRQADGLGAPASRSVDVGAVVKAVPSAATPTANPSWRAVFTAPEAMPLRSRGTAASAAEASVGLAMPTPAPRHGETGTSTRQVEWASTTVISSPPAPISSSPPPSTNRGGLSCSDAPGARRPPRS